MYPRYACVAWHSIELRGCYIRAHVQDVRIWTIRILCQPKTESVRLVALRRFILVDYPIFLPIDFRMKIKRKQG